MIIFQILLLPFIAVLLILFLLLVPPLLILFWIYRQCVIILAKCFRPELNSILSKFDVIFATSSHTLLTVVKLAGHISQKRFVELGQQRWIDLTDKQGNKPYQRLQQTWTKFMGYYFWKDDPEFKLENHIRDYDHEGELAISSSSGDNFNEVMAKLIKAPWKRNQSPWELLLVYNKTVISNDNEIAEETVIVLRFDHTLGDGYSAMGLIKHIGPTPCKFPSIINNVVKMSFKDRLRIIMKAPLEIAEGLMQIVSPPKNLGLQTTKPRSSTDYCCFTPLIPAERIKAIKIKHGVGFSTVLFSALNGAIRRHLLATGENVPYLINTGVPLPLPNHPEGMCNHLIGFLIHMPFGFADAEERLVRTEAAHQKFKESFMARLNVPAVMCLSSLPMPFFNFAFSLVNRPNYAATLFPATIGPETLDGLEIKDIVGYVHNEAIGLANLTSGVNNRLRLSFYVNQSIVGSEEQTIRLGKYFMEEIAALEKLPDITIL